MRSRCATPSISSPAASRPAAARSDAGAGRRDAAVGGLVVARDQDGEAACRRGARQRPRAAEPSRAWSRRSAGRPISSRTPEKIPAEGAGRARGHGAADRLRHRRSPRATSASPSSGWAAAARRPDDGIDHAVGLTGCCRSAPVEPASRWRWSMPARTPKQNALPPPLRRPMPSATPNRRRRRRSCAASVHHADLQLAIGIDSGNLYC